MLRLLTSLFEGFVGWVLTPRGLVLLTIGIILAGVSYFFWDTWFAPAFLNSLKSLVVKTIPKWGTMFAKAAGPMLTKAMAKRWGKIVLLIILKRILTAEEKKRVKNSTDGAVAVAKHYFIEKPKYWWNNKTEKQQMVITATVMVAVILLVLTPFLDLGVIAFLLLFFYKAVWRLIVTIGKFLFPRFFSAKGAKIVDEKVMPLLGRCVPTKIKESPLAYKLGEKMFTIEQNFKKGIDKTGLKVRQKVRRFKERQALKKPIRKNGSVPLLEKDQNPVEETE